MKYDEYELLELFGSEPTKIYEDGVGKLLYTKSDDYGFNLYMKICIEKRECDISLYFGNDRLIVMEELKDVECIRIRYKILRILQTGYDYNILLRFKPNTNISWEYGNLILFQM
jgi:hypothetical protein